MLRQAQLHIYAFPMCIYCQVQSAVLHWQWTCSSCPQLTAPAILPDAQHAMGVMELARKMDPGLGECFMLFVKVKVKVGKSLHKLNFPVLTSSFRPLFDLPDAPSAVPPTSSEWVPGRPVPKPWRFY